ncbi:ribosome maturation factor RimM [Flavobacteriales bacterium]|nr:ribosome maturation factor RimM [Flavobacteriales bacterium]
MNIDDCFLLGKITKPHGYKGDVILYIDADQPELYRELDCIWLEIGGRLVPHFLDETKTHSSSQKLIVHLEGVDDENSAKSLGGSNVFLPTKYLPELGEDQFYLHEVEGWRVADAESEITVGTIAKVLDYAMYPILEVHSDGNEVLVPLPPEIDIRVDRAEQQLFVTIPEGLLDVYLGTSLDSDDANDFQWDGEEQEDAGA